MTKSEIQNHIQRLQIGRAATNDSHQIELIDLGLKKYRGMLAELEKKSEAKQVPERLAAIEPKQEREERIQKQIEEQAVQQSQRQQETAQAFDMNPVLTAPQPKALTKMPAPTKPIKWANGKVYEMNELDLRRKSVDYFSDVLNGKREPKDFYRSTQFNNLVRFQIGLYRFGNEVMEHKALHPTLEMCKKETQERSEELYRQMVEYWKQYKDTDIV